MTLSYKILLLGLIQFCSFTSHVVGFMTLYKNIIPNNKCTYPSTRLTKMVGFGSLISEPKIKMGSAYDKRRNEVIIESPAMNSRRITSSIIIDGSMDDVWNVLTDYNKLATYVPNLTKSYTVPGSSLGTVRIFQEGAQKIIGFDFRASLTMDMYENPENFDAYDESDRALKQKHLGFKLVDSFMFSSFDGEWVLSTHSRSKAYDPNTKQNYYRYKTKLTYMVFVRPKGPVPVAALEWRIKEDVPLNLQAMKAAVEKRISSQSSSPNTSRLEVKDLMRTDWSDDETLGAYIAAIGGNYGTKV